MKQKGYDIVESFTGELREIKTSITIKGNMVLRLHFFSERHGRVVEVRYQLPRDNGKLERLLKALSILPPHGKIAEYDLYKTGKLYVQYVEYINRFIPVVMRLESLKRWKKKRAFKIITSAGKVT